MTSKPPTIDMTLDGTVLRPAGRWERALAFWRGLPPGAIPALAVAAVCVGALLVLALGLALLAIPALLLGGVLVIATRLLGGRAAGR